MLKENKMTPNSFIWALCVFVCAAIQRHAKGSNGFKVYKPEPAMMPVQIRSDYGSRVHESTKENAPTVDDHIYCVTMAMVDLPQVKKSNLSVISHATQVQKNVVSATSLIAIQFGTQINTNVNKNMTLDMVKRIPFGGFMADLDAINLGRWIPSKNEKEDDAITVDAYALVQRSPSFFASSLGFFWLSEVKGNIMFGVEATTAGWQNRSKAQSFYDSLFDLFVHSHELQSSGVFENLETFYAYLLNNPSGFESSRKDRTIHPLLDIKLYE